MRFKSKIFNVGFLIAFIIFLSAAVYAVEYSPKYFGPNANPVPEFANARIPDKTEIEFSYDYYFGFGDDTNSLSMSVEIPLLVEKVSFKIWINFFETYQVSAKVYDERNMEGGQLKGNAGGDFYVQTRILIFSEGAYNPAVILNSALKTASGTEFPQRRYFDTPGYYFDAEFGKSFFMNSEIINEIRNVLDLGFFCWETTNSVQDDAFMYGYRIILSNKFIDIENTLSGYYGWMQNGDTPLLCGLKISTRSKTKFFIQYKKGINDFPYNNVSLGIVFAIDMLTPRYK
ncbi:MAG: hypothetical protein LBT79_05015 [Elusimicrobiota bacterium]|jgi:hypothetical protein|nr:hypothetical protein [Elusimicrobiota bacterium]